MRYGFIYCLRLDFEKMIFLIRSAGMTVIESSAEIKRSCAFKGTHLKTSPPKYISASCVTITAVIIIINALFFERCAPRFILSVLTLKLLKTPQKMNIEKNTVR